MISLSQTGSTHFLYLLGHNVAWLSGRQYNTYTLDYNWPCTIINDINWQLRNCPYVRQQTISMFGIQSNLLIKTTKEKLHLWYLFIDGSFSEVCSGFTIHCFTVDLSFKASKRNNHRVVLQNILSEKKSRLVQINQPYNK